MKKAIVARTFRRSDNKKIVHPGYEIEAEDAYIDELRRQRLVRETAATPVAPENKVHPIPASAKSSASQAAPAAPQTTEILSAAGAALAELPAKRTRRTRRAKSVADEE